MADRNDGPPFVSRDSSIHQRTVLDECDGHGNGDCAQGGVGVSSGAKEEKESESSGCACVSNGETRENEHTEAPLYHGMRQAAELHRRALEEHCVPEEARGEGNAVPNASQGSDRKSGAGDARQREGEKPSPREIWEAVTPLGHLPYSEQLDKKKAEIAHVLKTLVRKTRKCCPRGQPLPQWVATARNRGYLACEYQGIMPSPQENGYRNKCEFSVGLSGSGLRTVGFQLGMFKEGVTAVAEPQKCKNVSVVAVQYAYLLQHVVRVSSLSVWDKKLNVGFWRMLTVREGRPPEAREGNDEDCGAAEVMLIVQVNPEGVSSEMYKEEMDRMADILYKGAKEASLPLTVLLLQEYSGVSNAAPANCPLRRLSLPGQAERGEVDESVGMCIHEHLGGLKFRLSPTAFFQVNTAAAEKLYSLAGDWAGLGPDTLLFDICCGTGTIGLTLAHRVAMVVGIEMNEFAVEDARRNMALNGITNCVFVASKAEDVMERLLEEYLEESTEEGEEREGAPAGKKARGSDLEESGGLPAPCSGSGPRRKYTSVVAIVDPPRPGLHPTVVRTLRSHARLRKLVYVSCNAASMASNALELCTPTQEAATSSDSLQRKRSRGGEATVATAKHRLQGMASTPPFQPVKAMAVDMFPHTAHCEVVLLFER